ncbi:MAG: ribosome maturation factor RimM [Actinomycetota bacterium]|nr:ribosome maturation factor RimM [Actinomycetota bacterium]
MEGLSDPVAIGVVVGPHGVRGTLRVRAFGSGVHLREGTAPLLAGHRRRIKAVRDTPKGFLLDLEGVESRAEVGAFRGAELLLDRAELDAPGADEFYVADLLGLTAVDDSGEIVGTVTETFESPAHEVLVIREAENAPDLLVPFTLEHVPEVDMEAARLIVRPPEDPTR